MISPALEKQRQQLFTQTVSGMARRVAAVDEPAKMFTALRWGMGELERAFAETPAKVRATVACRAGCGWCCSVPVDAPADEVFLAAEHIQLNFSPADLAAVIERTAVHRAQIGAMASDARAQRMEPC